MTTAVTVSSYGEIQLAWSVSLNTVTGGQVTVGQWFHIAAVYDGSELSLWQDGLLQATFAANALLTSPGTQPLVLGGNAPEGDRLIGVLDTLRLWNTARTALQIEASAAARP